MVLAEPARLSTAEGSGCFTKLLDGGRCVDSRCRWPRVRHLGVLAYRLSVARIGGLRDRVRVVLLAGLAVPPGRGLNRAPWRGSLRS